jgi:hypothetical protein
VRFSPLADSPRADSFVSPENVTVFPRDSPPSLDRFGDGDDESSGFFFAPLAVDVFAIGYFFFPFERGLLSKTKYGILFCAARRKTDRVSFFSF